MHKYNKYIKHIKRFENKQKRIRNLGDKEH